MYSVSVNFDVEIVGSEGIAAYISCDSQRRLSRAGIYNVHYSTAGEKIAKRSIFVSVNANDRAVGQGTREQITLAPKLDDGKLFNK